MADEAEDGAPAPEATPGAPEATPGAPEATPGAPEPEATPGAPEATPGEPEATPGAPTPAEVPAEAAPPAPVAAEVPPAEPAEVKEEPGAPAEPTTEKEAAPKPEESRADSMVRASNVSFNKADDGAAPRPSLMAAEVRRSGVAGRALRRSMDMTRRSTKSNYYSMMSIKRGSFASMQQAAKITKYMNSYKLNAEKPFNPDKVHSIIVKILKDTIEDSMMYDPEQCPNNAKMISNLIRAKVKEQDFDRYKLICLVTIGEKKSQDVYTGVRFLWDADRDKYASHMHENMYIYATAIVFGVYYE